ncbi:MAG: TIGR02281 family clan AA aspartic protease [Pseudomonadota bacterium]
MIGRTLASVGAVCVFAALVVPTGDESEDGTFFVPKPSAAGGNASQSGGNAGWYGGDHTLTRQSDGHFYANTSVDGASVRMMVDTGASVIALTGSDAAAVGLYWDDSEVRVIGSGASGPVYGVETRLSEVEIGGMVRRNVDAVIIPEGLGVSLLGQSYLRQVGGVEIADNRMVFRAN